MTVSTAVAATLYVFTGPGVFTFTFPVLEPQYVKCTLMKTGAASIFLVYNVDFTVALAPLGAPGGSVTIIDHDPETYVDWTDWSLEVRRIMPITQEIDWVNNGPFNMELFEYAVDKLTLIAQQVQVQMEGGWVYPLPTAASLQQLLYDIKQIDGHNSGIDADTIDGLHSSQLLTLDGVINAGFVTDTYLQAQGYVDLAALQAEGYASTDDITPAFVLDRVNAAFTLGNIALNSNGYLIAYAGAASIPNRDFVLMDAGQLVYKRWRDGAYQTYMGLKRCEFGVAESGETVYIDGWWESKPKLIISPFGLQTYDADKDTQSQAWVCAVENFREEPAGSGQYAFVAVAELTYKESAGVEVKNNTNTASANSWTSAEYDLVTNTTLLTVNVSSLSIRGNGTSTYGYYFRQVVATVQLWNPLTSTWVDSGSKTLAIGSTTSTVKTDSIACTGVTGKTKVRVLFTSSDVGGGFTIPPHADYYETSSVYIGPAQGAVSVTCTVFDSPAHYTNTFYLNGFSLPIGWELAGVDYFYDLKANAKIIGHYVYLPEGGSYTGMWDGVAYFAGTVEGAWQALSGGLATNTTWHNKQFTLSYFTNTLALHVYGEMRSYIGSTANMTIETAHANARIRKLTVNSSTPSNTNTLVSYSWETEDNVAISTGSLNWQAVGD